MCGRITQKSPPNQLGLGIVSLIEPLHVPPRYNGSPGQEHWVIRQNAETGERSLGRLLWGLIPYWVKEPAGGRKPINAKAETVASLPSFRDAYKRRRCLVPVDSFFEWRRIESAGAKQPFAIGMKDEAPFAIAGIWENWRPPGSETWVRTFAVITTTANELLSSIHDRMPVIIPASSYDHWLSPLDPDPRNLLVPFPSAPMTMWPISTRVNKPANDDAAILEPVQAG
jgi:putative SOS response-associated peptidase YedK